jgi:hypothetical protein
MNARVVQGKSKLLGKTQGILFMQIGTSNPDWTMNKSFAVFRWCFLKREPFVLHSKKNEQLID